jgi:hypothetical protein
LVSRRPGLHKEILVELLLLVEELDRFLRPHLCGQTLPYMPRYQLSILAENLPRGTFGRPNPYAKVVVSGGPREGETIGQTETLESTQDADFLKTIFLETDASIFMPLKVTIYNGRNDSVLTEGIFEATEVNASPGHTQEQKDPANGARFVGMSSI